MKYAQRCDASEFHCTDVWAGPSFLTPTDTWQNRQSTETSPDGQVALAITLGGLP